MQYPMLALIYWSVCVSIMAVVMIKARSITNDNQARM